MFLYHPQYLKIREYIHDNLKKDYLFYVDLEFPFWRNRVLGITRKLGGGAFLDVGCYPISLIADIFVRKIRCID